MNEESRLESGKTEFDVWADRIFESAEHNLKQIGFFSHSWRLGHDDLIDRENDVGESPQSFNLYEGATAVDLHVIADKIQAIHPEYEAFITSQGNRSLQLNIKKRKEIS